MPSESNLYLKPSTVIVLSTKYVGAISIPKSPVSIVSISVPLVLGNSTVPLPAYSHSPGLKSSPVPGFVIPGYKK